MNTKPQTIVLVSDTVFDSNGVSRFISDMASISPKLGSVFVVLTSSSLQVFGRKRNVFNFKPFFSVRMPFYREQTLTLIPPFMTLFRRVRHLKPDVIHISTPGPLGVSALIIAKILGIKAVGTYHTDIPGYIYKNTQKKFVRDLTTLVMRLFYNRLDRVFVRSRSNLSLLEDSIKIRHDRLYEIQAGTNTTIFSPRFRIEHFWSAYGIDEDTLKMLYVGRLSNEKNFSLLLKLFEKYRSISDRNICLIVIGEGELLAERELFRASAIYLMGRKGGEELSKIYANSDFFLFPSITETLGQAVMEAAASGLPCIVSNEGGVTQTIENGENGYTLDVNDEALWLEKIDLIVRNEQLRLAMGREARKRMENCSIEASCKKFLEQHRF